MIKDQRIRDPIHNLISFSHNREEDVLLWRLLQTGPVQRLRRIKQLGFSEFVYPGATHTRFSHVLGAMQMARRMLDVFEKNDIFPVCPDRRKATLAAALLHDVGHGPYSHVFEDLAEKLGLRQNHEKYTFEIINQDCISDILESHGVKQQTLKFFSSEAGYDPYSNIISSQMDCDRLDFITRDRYFTGIRSSKLDLEWLFDSLRVAEIQIDEEGDLKRHSFYVDKKGVIAAEEFVLSYMRMYQNVYFHKTTRSMQHIATDILIHALSEKWRDHATIKNDPLARYFLDETYRSTETYLQLDDSSFASIIRNIYSSDMGELSELARRYLHREVYKCFELPIAEGGRIKKSVSGKLIKFLREEDILYVLDKLPQKKYKQYDVADESFLQNILVKVDDEYQPLGAISQVVRSAPAQVGRIYIKDLSKVDVVRDFLRKEA